MIYSQLTSEKSRRILTIIMENYTSSNYAAFGLDPFMYRVTNYTQIVKIFYKEILNVYTGEGCHSNISLCTNIQSDSILHGNTSTLDSDHEYWQISSY